MLSLETDFDCDWHPAEEELQQYCAVWLRNPHLVDDDTFLKYEMHMLCCDECVALAKRFEQGLSLAVAKAAG